MEQLNNLRALFCVAMLIYASKSDWFTRRVSNNVWIYSGSFAISLLILDLFLENDPWTNWAIVFVSSILFYNAFIDEYELEQKYLKAWKGAQILAAISFLAFIHFSNIDTLSENSLRAVDLFSVSLLIIFMYVWYYYGPTIGGADVKAIMTLALLVPFSPSINSNLITAFDSRGFPFPFVVFMNSLLVYLAIPLSLFLLNIGRRDISSPYLQMFVGIRMPISEARNSFVWPLERIINGKKILTAYVVRGEPEDKIWNSLEEAGIDRPWVSLKVPYIIPLTIGMILSILIGDLFTTLLVAPLQNLF